MVGVILEAGTVAGARAPVTAVAAVVGLFIGSFLNVVVYRTPRGLSVVRPGSFCPSCETPIRPWDNVPVVSWLVLRARCRRCGEPISVRYPLVELVTGAVFGAVAWALGPHWAVPGMCVLGATALTLAAIDLDGLPPPATVSLVGTGGGALLLSAAAIADRRWWHLGGMLIGIALSLGALMAVRWEARRHGAAPALWALVPAGAVLGWTGPLGAVVGVITSVVVGMGLWVFARPLPGHEGPWRVPPVALSVALGSTAAVIAAFAAGSSIGA